MLSGIRRVRVLRKATPTGRRNASVNTLSNRGGFIYMPTHGNTEEAMRPARRVLRQILPEYHLTVIPQDHELYSSFYDLNGPLRFPVRKIGSTILHHGPYSRPVARRFY